MALKSSFKGFNPDLFRFLKELSENNNPIWFKENKPRYQKIFTEPARSFVNDLAPLFNLINPAIRTEPKFNITLMRLNKDLRFTKGEPYKNYFLIHFNRFKGDSEFFIYFSKDEIQIGLFLNNTGKKEFLFRENYSRNTPLFNEVYAKYTGNFPPDLYELDKIPVLLQKEYNPAVSPELLLRTRFILLQYVYAKETPFIYNQGISEKATEIFTRLYPLYLFGISEYLPGDIKMFENYAGFTF